MDGFEIRHRLAVACTGDLKQFPTCRVSVSVGKCFPAIPSGQAVAIHSVVFAHVSLGSVVVHILTVYERTDHLYNVLLRIIVSMNCPHLFK